MSRTVVGLVALVVILCATLVPAVVMLVGTLREYDDEDR